MLLAAEAREAEAIKLEMSKIAFIVNKSWEDDGLNMQEIGNFWIFFIASD